MVAESGNNEPQVFDVEMRVTVRVTVNDPLVIRRPVENIDNWQGDLYPLKTRDEVLEMLASNAARNGVWRANRLDGWADLSDTATNMDPVDATLEEVYEIDVSHVR